MTHRELALEFVRCFCAGDIERLEPLLAPDLAFTGTLRSYDSAAAYLDGLRADPPRKCAHEVLSVTESEDAVAVFYQCGAPEAPLAIAQLFRFRAGRIREMRVVFDARGFG